MAEENQDPVETTLAKIKPVVGNLTFGTMMGYCSGLAMKKIGKAVAVLVGVTFIGLQVAASSGFIQIDWEKISVSIKNKVDATGDGKIDMDDVKSYWKKLKEILTDRVPAAGGFSFGFLYGVRSG